MANCTNCSAPLPANSITCEYCGSRNDIDLKGVHYYTTHAAQSDRICPRCAVPLQTIDLQLQGTFLIERCGECLGLFFDPNELETVLDQSVTSAFTVNTAELDRINASGPVSHGAAYVKCPICGTLMNRVNFGARSGVVVNSCRDHGLWLDGGDLRRLMEWSKAGGMVLERQRQDERKKEALRDEEKRKKEGETTFPSQGSGTSDGLFDGWGFGQSRTPDLLDVVFAAVRTLVD
ncbi:zf-TFIIB domain-containing protein [Geomesophilobacter sediminis]|uniref:Zf-TFIIB domain-containing protein n=1 Tax=Geomesophilobacter sediminis TaxID=2798584 RepID=A0A8J7LWA1_9BACT|nr:zf-TFIIB domain-containing protein [Geomesophilobacter sediminis]MBJ6725530.1 zf-TFIIB domain-containing protein [Geomesophilobacter sediminis]